MFMLTTSSLSRSWSTWSPRPADGQVAGTAHQCPDKEALQGGAGGLEVGVVPSSITVTHVRGSKLSLPRFKLRRADSGIPGLRHRIRRRRHGNRKYECWNGDERYRSVPRVNRRPDDGNRLFPAEYCFRR